MARLPVRLTCLCSLALLFVILPGCGSPAQSSSSAEAPSSTSVPVEVATVARGVATAQLSSTTSLEARDEATVVARVGGVVERILVEEGQYVQAGQSLAQLDDERLDLELRRAEVALQQLEQAFERSQTMYDKQLVSSETYDQARSDYEAQKAATELARLELSHATVRAPISGWISRRHVKAGNMVGANEATFHITDLSALWAVLHLPERELSKLSVGQPATLRLDALPDRTFEGRVALISPVVDSETGTIRTTVEIRDPSRTAKPGMFGRVQIQYDRRADALLIPKGAVVEEDDLSTVFIAQDSVAVRRPVTTSYVLGDQIEVTDGLADGDRVVVSGQSALQDSARVEIVP